MSFIKRFLRETVVLLRSIPSFITAIFVASVIAMNLLANKSIDLPWSWLALDCGILFSWIAFLSMDIVTRRYGVKAANTLSVVALLVNLLISLVFIAASYIPGTWSQSYVEGSEGIINNALNLTFSSSWFVILGSSTAFIVSAVINNVLHAFIEKKFKKANFAAFSVSSYVSTFIAQFIDNLLFAFIVSLHFFGWTATQCVTCAVTGAVVELIGEVIFSPLGYRAAKRLEQDNVGADYLALINKNPEVESKEEN